MPSWDQIARRLGGRVRARVDGPARRAAVALLLREGTEGFELLFIRRAEHDLDPWSGHVGFPGGRAEPGDASLEATAVRETREEVAIDLVSEARLLGPLDEIHATARFQPVDLVIAPFVFRLLSAAEGSASDEVVSLHWLSLGQLLDPRSRSSLHYGHEGGSVELPCLRIGELVVWGLTFRMFENLRALLDETA